MKQARVLALAAFTLLFAITLTSGGRPGSAVTLDCWITVDSPADTVADDGAVTLREAILYATDAAEPPASELGQISGCPGDDDNPGATRQDKIVFDVTTFPPFPASTVVSLSAGLPPLSTGGDWVDAEGAGVVVDGGDSGLTCFTVNSDGNAIKSLRIRHCLVGIRIDGTLSLVRNNVVGGVEQPGDGNVLGANGTGVLIVGPGARENLLAGNLIGTDVSGVAADPNETGVKIDGAPYNSVGDAVSLAVAGRPAGSGGMPGNLISGNAGDGVVITGASAQGNVVQSNLIGTDITGTAALGNGGDGVYVSGALDTVIGPAVLAPAVASPSGNVISGNDAHGIEVVAGAATLIRGNLIGTDASGFSALGNGLAGVRLAESPGNTVGGLQEEAANVISGNRGPGVHITGAGSAGNLIRGNLIGPAVDGATIVGNGGQGVLVTSAGHNMIGGTVPGSGNLIAGNDGAGVAVVATPAPSVSKAILGNSIYQNGGLGIDLEDDGITLNDPADPDVGANGLQNYPVLTAAVAGSGTEVDGWLNSTPNTGFRIEFFANDSCDVSGYGEGAQFLGSAVVTTDGDGNAVLHASLPVAATAGQAVTATATDPANNTSEFSACVLVTEAATPTPSPTPEPTATPSPTPTASPAGVQGDTDCDQDVDSVDALWVLRQVAGLSTGACIDHGDVQCDGDIDAVDALGILRYVASLPPIPANQGCPTVGGSL